ncbi:GspH/FimT family pseudopilin [Oscillatoria sp. FACHB-1407]|uniref:GspH/FimT family pseudopilin n=1 Tax=Oscillatoria sp. FACHB-1407 TaxID=2692847 RepID=UPI0016870392|nr:GspH/FimT family pseudopilin [Oscillatoria sp. FACHB-1407]MBD2462849.1 GspH/FimT family pseudopilin [Oscillatoria sp. FACHB-1407]
MKRQLLQRQSTAGFSLLELLVVIVMAAILASIAGVSWVGFLNRQRVTNAREQVQQAIRLAQTEAVRTRRRQTVTFNTAVNPPTVRVGPSTEQLGFGQLRPGMISMQTPVNQITFDDEGNLTLDSNPPIVFTFKAPANTGRSRCLIIETLLGATRNAEQGEPGCT